MNHQPQTSRFDEDETVRLISSFGVKVSSETWNDLQNFLKGSKEEFLTQERQKENSRQRPGRDI